MIFTQTVIVLIQDRDDPYEDTDSDERWEVLEDPPVTGLHTRVEFYIGLSEYTDRQVVDTVS